MTGPFTMFRMIDHVFVGAGPVFYPCAHTLGLVWFTVIPNSEEFTFHLPTLNQLFVWDKEG